MANETSEKSVKEKIGKGLSAIGAEEKLEDAYAYSVSHKADAIAYVILFMGILLSFFNMFYGAGLIGIITGVYFSDEIVNFISRYQEFLDRKGIFKMFVLGGAALGLFIAAPTFFIGGAAAAGLKTLIVSNGSSSTKNEQGDGDPDLN